MKILVLGATGRIGQHLLAQGLARGHEITVLVRYPEKLGPVQNRVRVVVGDALEARAVERAITGQKAVVYALGSRQLGPTTFFPNRHGCCYEPWRNRVSTGSSASPEWGREKLRGMADFSMTTSSFRSSRRECMPTKTARRRSSGRALWIGSWCARRSSGRGVVPGPLQVVTNVQGVTLRRIAPAEVAHFVLEQ